MKTRRNSCVLMLCLAILLLAFASTVSGQSPSATTTTTGAGTQAANQSPIIGEWQGAISRQHLILKFDQAVDGSLNGTLVLPDQNNASVPFDSVAWQDGSLRFELKRASAGYEGKLSADGTEINGTWKQSGNSVPLLLHRPGAAATKFTLSPKTQGKIALEPCRTADGNTEGLCGHYDVYENRQLKTGRRIALNIMVLPAKAVKPEPDAFFALAGGPGQSSTESFPLAGFVPKIRELRDVVLVDQRGTGKSNPLQCTLQNLDDAQAVLGEPYSLDKLRECRSESDKKADTTQYTTSIAADDLDEVREALGYDKINVFGGSYGTKAALVYLRLHGEHVHTLSLEAVASPEFLIPVPFAKALQSSVNGVISLCEADAACHAKYPDLRKEFQTVVERLAKSPAHFEVKGQPVTLSKEMFVSKLRGLLYIPEFVSAFPLLVHQVYGNDWSGYGNTVMALAGAFEAAVARGASFAAICAEDIPGLTEAVIKRDTEGTYVGDSQVRRYQRYCEAWGAAGNIPKDFHSPAPTLLISGALDPATPPETARQAARNLSNSRLVVVKQGTHGTGSACIDGLIATFVQQGSAAGLDVSCADQVRLPEFVGK
jgi:pimeloyl-ACP methyl ester carboxylesterase